MWRRKTGGKLGELEAQHTQMRRQLDGIAAFFASQAARPGPNADDSLAGVPSGLVAARYGSSAGEAVALTVATRQSSPLCVAAATRPNGGLRSATGCRLDPD